ncbi:primosomal protein N' [Bacteroides fragilis str. S6L8]|uniref:Replication restart protein PriA n=1 Tax=Bacteroides fragilis str. S36L11 TaxID=1339327 RepID=A0A015Y448_BACFG|nr:primosomal protein N' [Bacteroides fragilis]EYE42992.1 primosomal protein N' [Bacteroides fragilis str. S6L5]EXY98538.1 primosomal protein N' [Bacteroides fragilis str. DS-166]EXZ26687.1 primosomal protein N' [Bacteroides fragilis str. S36L11]EYA02863.1 primosomal protein N' [Bacteroides fragilis str. S6L3]EYA07390.1 primosomal protein N' [Bacteroides fragilis str. S6R6]
MKKYVDVILPLPLPRCFTYSLPDEGAEEVQIGCRVVVPFGRKKYYTAIVRNVHHYAPTEYEVKEISTVLDTSPILLPGQFRFWEWLADYYLCTQGDVYKAALPSGLKLESETIVEYNPDFEADAPLSEREQLVLDLLAKEPEQCVTKLEKESGLKNILTVIKSLLDKEALFVKEELRRTYKPKTEARVRLAADASGEENLRRIFDELERAPKQLALLMKYVELSGVLGDGASKEVSKKELLQRASASPAIFNGLVEKQIFEVYYQEIGRLNRLVGKTVELNVLNEHQQRAYHEIMQSFQEKNVCLLHGVTSSGKTEVYIHLIEETLRQGRQVLYLLPEIALTTQITERLKRVFGSRLGIYHSKFPDAERVEIWQKQLTEEGYDIILGVRSSVFLPFRNLGLVIVDEEHENTYKQQDPAPRYHARNAAIVLASMYGAKTLLGTATPSVETWQNATTGKFGWVELKERYKEIQLPEIIPVDIKELHRKKRMTGQFSPLLLQYVREALDNKQQVILFQNRRGFAPMIECRTCGWVPKCKNCDVSLTYHKGINQLTCHYCGYTYQLPRSCPACEGVELMHRGFGTEKIEDDVKLIFPEASVVRMDLDTTRTRSAYEKIIADFEQGKTDILIGTQMVSKGLDFDHVSVVGILNADTMLNYPDFRSYERAFQLMAQVAGRAGRKNKRGRVVLQTKSIDHPIIRQVMTNDYEDMVAGQLAERQMFHYPPYYRMVYVYLKNRNETLLDVMAHTMAEKLRALFGNRILGPDKPPVARIQTLFIRKIVVKIEQNAPMSRARELLLRVQREMIEDERFKSLIVYYDVDPM